MRVILSAIFLYVVLFQAIGQTHPVAPRTPFNHLKVSGNIHLELVSDDTQQLILVSVERPEAVDIEADS